MAWVAGVPSPSRRLLYQALPLRFNARTLLSVAGGDARLNAVIPTPATHAILTVLKAGEIVCQTLFVPKLEFQTLKTLCQTLSVTKTASETLFSRPSMCLGCGARRMSGIKRETSEGAQSDQPPQPSDHVLTGLKAGECIRQFCWH